MKETEKIDVRFQAGVCRNPTEGSCNYMLATATDGEGNEIELYAEVATKGTPFDDYDPETQDFDFDGFDDYSYPILKAEIIQQAIENGISTDKLKFWRD